MKNIIERLSEIQMMRTHVSSVWCVVEGLHVVTLDLWPQLFSYAGDATRTVPSVFVQVVWLYVRAMWM